MVLEYFIQSSIDAGRIQGAVLEYKRYRLYKLD